jgi:hypothetical protein
MIAAKPGSADLRHHQRRAGRSDALKSPADASPSASTLPPRSSARHPLRQLDASTPGSLRRTAFGRLKIDTVVIRGVNDDELVAPETAARSTARFASSNTWTGRRQPLVGGGLVRGGRCWTLACRYGTIEPDRRAGLVGARRPLRPRTAPRSASSRRRPIRSAAPVTGAAHRDGMRTCACMRPAAWIARAAARRAARRATAGADPRRWGHARTGRGKTARARRSSRVVPVQDLLRKDPHLEMHTREDRQTGEWTGKAGRDALTCPALLPVPPSAPAPGAQRIRRQRPAERHVEHARPGPMPPQRVDDGGGVLPRRDQQIDRRLLAAGQTERVALSARSAVGSPAASGHRR